MVWTVKFQTKIANDVIYELLGRLQEGIPVGIYVGDGRDLKVRMSMDTNNFSVIAAMLQQHFGEMPMGIQGTAQAPMQPQYTQAPMQPHTQAPMQPPMQPQYTQAPVQPEFNPVMNQLPSAGPVQGIQQQIPPELWAMVQAAQNAGMAPGAVAPVVDIPGTVVTNENGTQPAQSQDSQ